MDLENDDVNVADQPAIVDPKPAAEPTDVRSAVRQAYDESLARTEADAAEGDQPKSAAERARDAHGRFSPKSGDDAPAPDKAATEAAKPLEQPKEGEAEHPIALKPPVGWNAAARAQFERLPPEVKDAVARREVEINQGFAVLQKYKGLEAYTPVIEASGITHAEFAKRAVEWEQSLKSNPVWTLLHVAKLGNVDIVRLAQIIQQQGGQAQVLQRGVQGGQQAQQPQRQAPAPQPQDLERIVDRRLAERETNREVETFLSDPQHIHADAVADHMAMLIETGQANGLKDAYEMACWARPDIRALLIKQQGSQPSNGVSPTQRAATQARSAAKATTGAPAGNPPVNRGPEAKTVRDAVRQAYEQAVGDA